MQFYMHGVNVQSAINLTLKIAITLALEVGIKFYIGVDNLRVGISFFVIDS